MNVDREQLVLSRELRGARAVVCATGEIDAATADAFERCLTEAGAELPDGGALVVDLTRVEYLNSAGLAVLIRSLAGCRGRRIDFTVIPGPVVARTMRMVDLHLVIATAESVDDALPELLPNAVPGARDRGVGTHVDSTPRPGPRRLG